jgi:uncharacterized protein YjbI with pentapeptide repeats
MSDDTSQRQRRRTIMAPCSHEDCAEDRWAGSSEGHCLYHSVENGDDRETARRVWQLARQRAQKGDANYEGWHFPADPAMKGFQKIAFAQAPNFDGATFSGAVYLREADFSGTDGYDSCSFRKAHFKSWAYFDDAVFVQADFIGTVFDGRVSFTNARFQAEAQFYDCRFEQADFAGAHFEEIAAFADASFTSDATFDGATFADSSFVHAAFKGPASFAGCHFTSDASFTGCAFVSAIFSGTSFEGKADFEGTRAVDKVDFDLAKERSESQAAPFKEHRHSQTAYRLAKQAAQDSGDYRRAGEYHYAEQCAIQEEHRSGCEMRPWVRAHWTRKNQRLVRETTSELVFGRLLFGYGEKPQRVFIAGVLVILACAVIYYFAGALNMTSNGLPATTMLDAFHFSAVTFTTLGYGDLVPVGAWRLMADLEAIVGAALMALFIVGLTRKYSR